MLDPHDSRLAQAWETLQAQRDLGLPLDPESNRLAFADPEFLLRRETRGIRFQLELLKPDLAMQAQGIHHTLVVFGSARYRSQADADVALQQALELQDEAAIRKARILVRNAVYYEQARQFGALAVRRGATQPPSERLYVCTGGGPGIMEAANMGDALNYLEDGMACEVVFYDGKAISIELPTTVVREITWTEPAVKGDTSGKVLKPAKIATGYEVAVPLFVDQGDKIEIDTRTGEYRKRV